jgi:hypothetical protein
MHNPPLTALYLGLAIVATMAVAVSLVAYTYLIA